MSFSPIGRVTRLPEVQHAFDDHEQRIFASTHLSEPGAGASASMRVRLVALRDQPHDEVYMAGTTTYVRARCGKIDTGSGVHVVMSVFLLGQ